MKMIPGNSPDVMPIESEFGRMKQLLKTRSTRTISELKKEVVKVWRQLPNNYTKDACLSMPPGIKRVINNKGYPIKY